MSPACPLRGLVYFFFYGCNLGSVRARVCVYVCTCAEPVQVVLLQSCREVTIGHWEGSRCACALLAQLDASIICQIFVFNFLNNLTNIHENKNSLFF